MLRNAWYIGAWADELDNKSLARRICGDPLSCFFATARAERRRLPTAAVIALHRCISGASSRPASSAGITASFSTRRDTA